MAGTTSSRFAPGQDRTEILEALKETEQRFGMLVDAVVDYAIYMLDPNGRITNWNKGAERIKGYTADEIVGQNFSRFYTPEDLATGLPSRALGVAAEEGRFEAEGWRLRKDGSRFWANVVIDPIRDEDGTLLGFAKVTRDITERRLAQESLERARHELLQSQKMESLGQLTGGVAHDFNNALTAIVGNLELVKQSGAVEGVTLAQIEAALTAARNGATIVSQMLAFARKRMLQPLILDLNQTLREIEVLVGRSCSESVELKFDLADDIPPIEADPSELQSALINLVINACDAMPDGGTLTIGSARRTLQSHPHLPPGDYVVLTVCDTGTGMTDDVRQHAFEPFFTTKEIGKGTGLGLSAVYGMARQLGGDVNIVTSEGQGTTIELLLPAASPGTPVPARKSESAAPETGTPSKIVFVEDDFLVSMATEEILREAGFEVYTAARAEQGLELIAQNPDIDLLITDIGLPGMNGHQLVAEARSRHEGPLKVMFVTGYDRIGPIVGTQPDEITIYVDKPYEPKALVKLVNKSDRLSHATRDWGVPEKLGR
jgi:PAS domain S-box-containing protein